MNEAVTEALKEIKSVIRLTEREETYIKFTLEQMFLLGEQNQLKNFIKKL